MGDEHITAICCNTDGSFVWLGDMKGNMVCMGSGDGAVAKEYEAEHKVPMRSICFKRGPLPEPPVEEEAPVEGEGEVPAEGEGEAPADGEEPPAE